MIIQGITHLEGGQNGVPGLAASIGSSNQEIDVSGIGYETVGLSLVPVCLGSIPVGLGVTKAS